jgi:DNA-directed RNA polymerase subunit RPC12/RpoP
MTMAFVVIVCSKCKWARGAKVESKRVKCTRCGATIDVRLARAFGRADNELDLARAVGEVNESLHRRGKKPVGVGPGSTNEPPRPKFKGEREFIMEFARTKGEFTLDEILQAMAASRGIAVQDVDKEKAMRAINDLMTKGFLFECRYCRYRIV